jgi:hypothetical protein
MSHVRLKSAVRTKADVCRPLQDLWVHAPDGPCSWDDFWQWFGRPILDAVVYEEADCAPRHQAIWCPVKACRNSSIVGSRSLSTPPAAGRRSKDSRSGSTTPGANRHRRWRRLQQDYAQRDVRRCEPAAEVIGGTLGGARARRGGEGQRYGDRHRPEVSYT